MRSVGGTFHSSFRRFGNSFLRLLLLRPTSTTFRTVSHSFFFTVVVGFAFLAINKCGYERGTVLATTTRQQTVNFGHTYHPLQNYPGEFYRNFLEVE